MSINKKLYEKVMEGPNREEAIREKMLDNITAEEISEAYSQYNIPVTVDDVCKKYEETYDLNETVGFFEDAFKDQLDALNDQRLYLDSSFLFFLVDKTVHTHYSPFDTPDPTIIAETIDDICTAIDCYSFDDVIRVTKSILKMKDYQDNKNLDQLFTMALALLSMNELAEIIQIYPKDHITLDQIKEEYQLIQEISDTYEFDIKELLLEITKQKVESIKSNKD